MDGLTLRLEPDAILRTVCKEVREINGDIFQLVKDMIACMQYNQGIGLAAPQVGYRHRLFVTQAPHDALRVFINPTILATSPEKCEIQEGCLSIPTIYGVISRAREITVEAHDQYGIPFKISVDSMLARVILHEYDHLEGVLFWDHLSSKKRKNLQKQYRAP